MKAGDSVGFKAGWQGEIPSRCGTHQRIWGLAHHGDTGTLLHLDGEGRAAVALAGFGAALTGSGDTVEYLAPHFCLVVPAAALEPVVPPLPDGWTVERLDPTVTLYAPDGLIVARIGGDRMHLCATSYHAPADLLAALVHFVAVAGVSRV